MVNTLIPANYKYKKLEEERFGTPLLNIERQYDTTKNKNHDK